MGITIAQKTFPGWQHGGNTATLFYYAQESFVAANGVPVIAGRFPSENWRYRVECTIANNSLTIPAHSLEPTTNSDNKLVRWIPVLVDSTNIRRQFLLEDFRLPHELGDSISWEQIKIYNETAQPNFPNEYYTVAQTNKLFATLINNPAFLTAVITNQVFIDALAGSSTFHTALIENEDFLNAIKSDEDFINDLLVALMNSEIVSTPQNFTFNVTGAGAARAIWESVNSILPFSHYRLRVRRATD